MSELETQFRRSTLERLHRAVWSHWLLTERYHLGSAKFTRLDVLEAQRLIRNDETTVLHSEAMELRTRWDALILKICEASGYDVDDGYDIAFSPYGERFVVLHWPPLGRRIPLAH